MRGHVCLVATGAMIAGAGLAGLFGTPALGQDDKAATPRTATTRNIAPTLKTDPPDNTLKCRQVVRVDASRHCRGGPAEITGGCDATGERRSVKCL
jgi:hypothetical protein